MAKVNRELWSRSADETFRLGERLGELLQPGDFVGLVGELGAGKTQLARGIAQGAGVPRELVASPTFAILYPYPGRLLLYHADLYRVADLDELYATGFLELVGGDGAMMVEWIDRVWQAAPEQRLILRMDAPTLDEDDLRRIVAEAHGHRPEALLDRWLAPPEDSA